VSSKAVFSVVDVERTLARVRGNAIDFTQVAQNLKRTVRPLLTLIAEALDERNLAYVKEASHLLRSAVSAVEAPQVVHSVSELEKHSINRDIDRATTGLAILQPLLARLMTEVSTISSA
jgi:hypothetical protein